MGKLTATDRDFPSTYGIGKYPEKLVEKDKQSQSAQCQFTPADLFAVLQRI